MYHQVSPNLPGLFRKYTVRPRAFASQMYWLARAHYKPISLDTLLAYRGGAGSLPAKPIIITFDDGFQDCFNYAVPVLKAQGFTAVFYLVAGLLGQTSRWLLAERGVEYPILGWSDASQLLGHGFQCGAHSLTHPHLAGLAAAACREELVISRSLLEQKLGVEIRHLAYPYGSFNEGVRTITAAAGYHTACSVQIGFSDLCDDPLALHRVPITGYDSLLDFISKLHTARGWREWLQSRVPARKQRQSSSRQTSA